MSTDADGAPATELPPEYLKLRDEAKALALRVVEDAGVADESTDLHIGMRDALRESGLARYTVPAAFGGASPRVDPLAVAVVREQLAYASAHLDSLFGMQGIGSLAVGEAASDSVKSEWMPKVARLETIAALALTEPAVGSDLRAITTSLDEEGGKLVLNGQKSFITNAGAAGFYTVLAREGDDYSLVFMPADAEGLTVEDGPDLIAPHILGSLRIDRVTLPAEYRVGPRGAGFKLALATLGTFRVSVAGAAVGVAQAALDEAVQHCGGRAQFGRSLLEVGAVSQTLARVWVDVEAARTFTYRAATAAKADPRQALQLSSMAKVFATETAGRAVDAAVQVMGRAGLVRGSTIERLYRNARPMRIYEGATEVILDSLARRLTAERKQDGT